MKLSRKGEYACLALLDLAEHYGEGFIKTADICERKEIPKSYLEQILLLLRHSRYIRSARGMEGGHQLYECPDGGSRWQHHLGVARRLWDHQRGGGDQRRAHTGQRDGDQHFGVPTGAGGAPVVHAGSSGE